MPITTNSADIANKTFDFVIAGGGTAGLTLAVRLTEDPSVSVAVLEAGDHKVGDPFITVPGQLGATIGNPKYDWTFLTEKQKNVNDRNILWSRGKGLGGSSLMNFYMWIRPPAGDVDAIEKLGNHGWNWEDFYNYARKAETFHPPGKGLTDLFPHTFDPEARGTSGPVQFTIPSSVHTLDTLAQKTFTNLGVKIIDDPLKGDVTGTYIANANLDPRSWTRSDAATAYLIPVQDRPNLTVLTEATVSRVKFAEGAPGQDLVATGLEFIHGDSTYTVNAGKEVILSSGTIQSPQILELSGIGRPEVLSAAGVELKLELPGVGENVQEHNFTGISFELDPAAKHLTLDYLRVPENVVEHQKLYAEGKGLLRTGVTSITYLPVSAMKTPGGDKFIETYTKEVQEWQKTPGLAPGLSEQLDIQLATLRDDSLPDFEIATFPSLFGRAGISNTITAEPGKSYTSLVSFIVHPLSRGTIHISSNDPKAYPTIDPHYFEKDSDLELLVQTIKFTRKMAETEPFKSGIVGVELEPGPQVTTDEQIREYVKNTLTASWHAVGSLSMLPKEKQGVVDPQLKVYGTKNLRVVDVSIVPLHAATHTQTFAYAIGEKAADIIRAAHKA